MILYVESPKELKKKKKSVTTKKQFQQSFSYKMNTCLIFPVILLVAVTTGM